jgi:hypothetical protein
MRRRRDSGFSLPIVWIVLFIFIILHLFFGWIVWLGLLAIFLFITLGVFLYDLVDDSEEG